MKSRVVLIGSILVALGLVGYLTVADDLRHLGEFFGVSSVLVSGLALLLAGLFPRWESTLALSCVPLGIGVGLIIGALVNEVPVGAVLGIALGLLVARARRTTDRAFDP